MRSLPILLALLLLLTPLSSVASVSAQTGATDAPPEPPEPPEAAAEVRVWQHVVRERTLHIGNGTFVTAAHLVEDEPDAITLHNERVDAAATVTDWVRSDDGDIAILTAEEPGLTALAWGSEVSEGLSVAVAGYPLGQGEGGWIAAGIVSRVFTDEAGVTQLQTTNGPCVFWEESRWRSNPQHIAGDPYGGSHGIAQMNGVYTGQWGDPGYGLPLFDLSRRGDPFYVRWYALQVFELKDGWYEWENSARACGIIP
ncbi:MAG: serine protease [Chloroflexi bacterium]|nr:serine protease [Chloroflexota bacterium]